MVASPTEQLPRYWPSARHFTEVIQCPSVCFGHPSLRQTLPAVDRLGMPIVTSGQFASPTEQLPRYWPSARHFTEVIQCPSVCFGHPSLRQTLPAVDRLGMPIVTSGQFAYVYKLKSMNGAGDFAVRCFRGYLGDRDQRYRALQEHVLGSPAPYLAPFSYAPEGILVSGTRFPILFMQWIEGPTLDAG